MKTITKPILIALFLILWHFTNAQVNYTYDANGNRISRYIVLTDQVSPNNNQQKEDSTYFKEDMIYYELSSNYTEQLDGQTLTIYPNPTGGAFAVRVTNMPEGLKRKMVLYSMSGNEVFHKEDFDELTEIDVSAQQSGTYLLKIMFGDKRTTWKIVKQ